MTVMALKTNNMKKRSGFKLRSGNKPDMQTLAGVKKADSKKTDGRAKSSAFQKLDVQIGEDVFTGDEAYQKGLEAEKKRKKLREEGGPASIDPFGKTDEEIRDLKEKEKEVAKKQTQTITYTGEDAKKRIRTAADQREFKETGKLVK